VTIIRVKRGTYQLAAGVVATKIMSETLSVSDVVSRVLRRTRVGTDTLVMSDAAVRAQAAGTPLLLYTDITSGSTTFNYNGKGAFLSLFGYFGGDNGIALGTDLKVYIGGVEVDNYRFIKDALNADSHGIQHLCVQVGALGSQTGSLAINVQVDGVNSNTDLTFYVQPGHFYFVDNVSGNDATGVVDDPAHPYRYLQRWNGSAYQGIFAVIKPGDTIVMRGTGTTYSDTENRTGAVMRMATGLGGSAPTGVIQHGYYHITAYPGSGSLEDVLISRTASGGLIVGNTEAQELAGVGQYVSISNIRLASAADSDDDGAPLNFQSGAHYWRAVNLDLTWPSNRSFAGAETHGALAGGISGNGTGIRIHGCNIHDIYINAPNGDWTQHGVYFDEANFCAHDCEASYNRIVDCTGGNGMMCYGGQGNDTFTGIKFNYNYIRTVKKHGLNFADGTQTCEAVGNVIVESGNSPIRFNTNESSRDINVTYNTVYNSMTAAGEDAYIAQTWNNLNGVEFKHNLLIAGPLTRTATSWFGGGTTGATFGYNLWYDARTSQTLTTKPSEDSATGIMPSGSGQVGTIVVNAAAGDFSLPSGSPVINQARATDPVSVPYDFVGHARPKSGNTYRAIGAYEVT